MSTVDDLLELAKVTRQLGYNLDIEWHTSVAGTPKWKIKVSHPSIGDDKFITCGGLEPALKEMYDKLPHAYK